MADTSILAEAPRLFRFFDKITQHHGDQSLWPVYMTIENLDRSTRRNQKRPSLFLVGLIPIVKTGKKQDKHLQAEVHHTAMEQIFKREFLHLEEVCANLGQVGRNWGIPTADNSSI